nr:hypothetical protein [Tanacetum cinerariifolium]
VSLDAHVVLTTQPACRPSPVSCLSLLEESLLSVTVAHGQSLGVLPSLSAASETHVTDAGFGSVYSASVDVSGVSEVGTPMHILAYGGSEAHGSTGGSGYKDGSSGGDGNAAGAVHLARRSLAEGGDSESNGFIDIDAVS